MELRKSGNGEIASPRPNKLTPEMLYESGLMTARELADGGHITEKQIERCARDLAKHGRPYIDGYDLAKALDDDEHWSPTFQMVEILDNFGWKASNRLQQEQKRWAAENNIMPPLSVGARVVLCGGETGEITGLYDLGPAQFLVKIDRDPAADKTNARRIVNFEDVEPEAA